jgi:hypothetical protein
MVSLLAFYPDLNRRLEVILSDFCPGVLSIAAFL